MSIRTYSLLKRICKTSGVRFSTVANVNVQEEQLQTFRTIESDPSCHNKSHLNRFYTIPNKICETTFQHQLSEQFMKQIKAFQECCILVRNPAIEIISYLEQTDYSRPINRYVLYGEYGAGKSLTLVHLAHYARMKKYILIHVHQAEVWFRRPKEVTTSLMSKNQMDLPIDAGIWLTYFKNQNYQLLKELDLKISKDYEWSQREITKNGTPLLELIDLGINRVKFACGIIQVLIDELKLCSTAGKCRTLIALDDYDQFSREVTTVRDETRVRVGANRVSLTTAFRSCTDFNWCNGAVIVAVPSLEPMGSQKSAFPRYPLSKEEFERLDPFMPVAVENYTPEEFETVMEYYKDRKWIRDITPEGQREIELLSNRNPYITFDICKSL